MRFIGPWDAESQDRLKQTLLMRDVLILQDALEERENEPQPDHEGATALVCALYLDQCVPQRYRLSDLEWTSQMMRLRGVPRKELRRRLDRGWAALGIEWNSSLRLPPMSRFIELLDQLLQAIADVKEAEAG